MSNIKPIIFSGPMVRALLEGRKTQTRRAIKRVADFGPVTEFGASDTPGYEFHFRDQRGLWNDCKDFAVLSRCPYGQQGDYLWVRETWDAPKTWTAGYAGNEVVDGWYFDRGKVIYRATDACQGPWDKWRPSIHMPRWASRLTLRITDVRVERVQEITNDDAINEGALESVEIPYVGSMTCDQAREAFRLLWNYINGTGAWDRNQWVWVLSFEIIHGNIDAVVSDPA